MNSWHILVPLLSAVGLLLFFGAIWLSARKHTNPLNWEIDEPWDDDRDWHGAFMKDMKSMPGGGRGRGRRR